MKDHLLCIKLVPGTKATQNINKCGRKFPIKRKKSLERIQNDDPM